MLPRPDLEALGVSYRRMPVLAHGRSVYCDSRLIIDYLESAFPSSDLAATTPEQEVIRKLLESWTIDGGVFNQASGALPPELPLLHDQNFVKDREQWAGRSFRADDIREMRPEALVHLLQIFTWLENGLLSDGRDWILGTRSPQIADIDAIFPLHWLNSMKTALPKDVFSSQKFPKVFAWIDRFDHAIKDAQKKMSPVRTIDSEQATAAILNFHSTPVEDDISDPFYTAGPNSLRKGDLIESWPTDTGAKNRDRGTLERLDGRECVLENAKGVLVHHPRWNFRIRAVPEGRKDMTSKI